jgi:hypothetical protein
MASHRRIHYATVEPDSLFRMHTGLERSRAGLFGLGTLRLAVELDLRKLLHRAPQRLLPGRMN